MGAPQTHKDSLHILKLHSSLPVRFHHQILAKKNIGSPNQIAIGNSLKLSPSFPSLHTVHATFTAHGVPSIFFLLAIYFSS